MVRSAFFTRVSNHEASGPSFETLADASSSEDEGIKPAMT
jgi:hypothetical protein